MATNHDRLAPLIDLINRLRGELDEKILGPKRRKLALVEATLELLLSQRRKAAPLSEEGGSAGKDAAEAGAQGGEAEGVTAQKQVLAHTQASERCCRGAYTSRCDGSGTAALYARWLVASVAVMEWGPRASAWPWRFR
jgi:hypothetical protein